MSDMLKLLDLPPSNYFVREIVGALCGNLISEGATRKVYECAANPRVVIKVEQDARCFQNINEWTLWQTAPEWLKDWLAPCVSISATGAVLVMERTKEIRKGYDMPNRIPEILTSGGDAKRWNFGLLGSKGIVCHDYGYVKHLSSRRSVKVKAWD